MNCAKKSTVEPAIFTWRLKLALVLMLTVLLFGQDAVARTVTYFYVDHQGSVLATADSNGVVTSLADYRPYGAVALGDGTRGLGYASHVGDDDVGLINMQARYYDPIALRFLFRDPAVYAPGALDGFGGYGLASNNPFRYVDPNGMASCGGGMDSPACVYSDPWLPRDDRLSNPFALSSSEGETHREGCDSS